MYLRLFVTLDDAPSTIGAVALGYMAALSRIARVRVIDPERMGSPELPGAWNRYHRALDTPMAGPFVNIVATRPERYAWTQRIEAALEDRPDDGDVPTEVIEGVAELYTAGVRNVLIGMPPAAPWTELQRSTIAKFAAVIVPVGTAAYPAPTWIVPQPVTDHATFRRHILGE